MISKEPSALHVSSTSSSSWPSERMTKSEEEKITSQEKWEDTRITVDAIVG